RRETDRRILAEALERLEAEFEPERDFGVVLAGDDWHPGVIGIVASRIVDRIHRPTVLVALDGERGRGSARSVPGFHLARALSSCGEHLERFGGHAQAAGMDVRRERLEGFRRAFRAEARRSLEGEDLRPTLRIDLELPLAEATRRLHDRLRHVGPFGIGNPRPVFLARGVRAAGPAREVGEGHLKLRLAGEGGELEAIGFGLCERVPPGSVGDGPLDAVFQLRENTYRGRSTLQARILDLRPSPAGAG
ncbi:MAG: single-stranded-DNA-specific exonuclease RecJ, partial [Gemmatimonadetes bacterium]|nr:single-stranded-DNA-specific exonuclease RecJ [Gemmatimonadota bacterium]NIR79284.1 single-stranded-DNA-specific exonuclease RecJ [Gemmatimonadota bacterium]NIT87943.1 single-stranded-DNA-specific exonuclease RecJ [Gemmatimonadota bacterium]NIU32083.1 single-stranded-DNA-specific exonuclease RecJ [Gemmatimonadota bacterium]NIU36409.1 single-stranded-DNA-specific exonuclease RecJ [Gemmatimonadota bacterium]